MPSHEVGGGKYKILRRIAVGGMAEIYLAEAANIHGFRKKVVIKRMLPQYATEQVYVDMFLDEARLVARLNHPSIVQVFDIGEDAEGVFFTMEFVEGRDLSDILGSCYRQKRLLTLGEVLAIAIPTAEGLHHAHELRGDDGELVNLIHRDVSPSNVIVTNDGRLKLLDFGVAKSKSQSRETTGVSLKGKFGYMAPEQCEGLVIDRRCDIYSFGVVLWELFTGRRLNGGGNEPAVLMRIMTEDAPPPSTVREDLPPELDAICMRALARKRDARYSTLQELLVDVDAFMNSSGLVVSSRTLSSMLKEVFEEERPTTAMPATPPVEDRMALRAPPQLERAQGTPQLGRGKSTPLAGRAQSTPPPDRAQSTPPPDRAQSTPLPAGGYPAASLPEASGDEAATMVNSMPEAPAQGEHAVQAPFGPTPFTASPSSAEYPILQPGTRYDPDSSDDLLPFRSRKRPLLIGLGALALVTFGILLSSGSESKEALPSSEASEAASDDSTETKPAAVEAGDPVPALVDPEVEAAAKKAAEEKAAADEKQAATDKKAAEKQAAAEKLAAEKQTAADKKAAEKQAAADKLAADRKGVADRIAADKAAANQLAADKAAAKKLAAEAAAKKAAAERAERAKAKNTTTKKPKDTKKPKEKWDPNSPFAPQ